MVAGQDVNRAPGRGGLAPEALQQVEQAQLGVSPVKNVADLDQRRLPARPPVVRVDQARRAQGANGLVVVAVEVAQGDQAAGGRVKGAGGGLCA